MLALTATGCGSEAEASHGEKPTAWAADVCAELNKWHRALEAKASARKFNPRDLASMKASQVTFLEDAETSADAMVEKVHAVGPPAVDHGALIQQRLETRLERLSSELSDAVAMVRALPPKRALTAIPPSSELSAFDWTMEELAQKSNDAEIAKAIRQAAACKELRSS